MMRSIYIQYRACAAPITSVRQLKSPAIIKVRFPVRQTFYSQIAALSQPFIGEMWQIVCDFDFPHCSKPNPACPHRNAARGKRGHGVFLTRRAPAAAALPPSGNVAPAPGRIRKQRPI